MPDANNSNNMNLPIPVVSVAPGPEWASYLNACLTLVDLHDHSPGNGVAITPSGLNINSDLEFNENNLTLVRSARFSAQDVVFSDPTDLLCVYVVDEDLYFSDGSGNQVRITQSGGVAGSPGSISNLVAPASAAYVSANDTFVWESDATIPANMDFASAIFRNLSAGSFGLTLQPPAAMASDTTLTLPTLPASTRILSMTTGGAMAAGAAGAVVTADLAAEAATYAKVGPCNEIISSSSGSFTVVNQSGSVDITNLSVSFTASGTKTVEISLVPDSDTARTSFVGVAPTSVAATNVACRIAFNRDAFGVGSTMRLGVGGASSTAMLIDVPPGAFVQTDRPVAGTYTYKAVIIGGGTNTASVSYCKLRVREI